MGIIDVKKQHDLFWHEVRHLKDFIFIMRDTADKYHGAKRCFTWNRTWRTIQYHLGKTISEACSDWVDSYDKEIRNWIQECMNEKAKEIE
jgi:hypothetical protein